MSALHPRKMSQDEVVAEVERLRALLAEYKATHEEFKRNASDAITELTRECDARRALIKAAEFADGAGGSAWCPWCGSEAIGMRHALPPTRPCPHRAVPSVLPEWDCAMSHATEKELALCLSHALGVLRTINRNQVDLFEFGAQFRLQLRIAAALATWEAEAERAVPRELERMSQGEAVAEIQRLQSQLTAFNEVHDAAMRALDATVPTGEHDREAAFDNLFNTLTKHRRAP